MDTRELDGEHLDVGEGTFDAAISRIGLIYFPDRRAALTGMRNALRPGGRISCVTECVRFERESFGALHQMLAGLDSEDREAAWREIAEALAEFDGPGGFTGPCEMLVVSGAR